MPDLPIVLTPPTFAPGYCPANLQTFANDLMAGTVLSAPISTDNVIISQTTPAIADRGKMWAQVNANGKIAAWRAWNTALGIWDTFQGVPYFALTTGAANAFVFSINDPDIVSLASIDGRLFLAQANFAVTGAATLQFNETSVPLALAAKSLKKFYNQDLAPNDIASGQFFLFSYSATQDAFQILSAIAPTSLQGAYVFNAYPSASTTWVAPSGPYQQIHIDSITFDPDSVFDATTYTFKAPKAGYYQFSLSMNADPAIALPFGIAIAKNGDPATTGTLLAQTSSKDAGASITTICKLAVGDTIAAWGKDNGAGGAKAVAGPTFGFLTGTFLRAT